MSIVSASLAWANSEVICGPASWAQVASRRSAAEASRAWTVDSDPEPASIALIIAHTSGPRTSPTIWRDRLNRCES
jgi:hypothetical protein